MTVTRERAGDALLSVEEAAARILGGIVPLVGEVAPLVEAAGRVLAEPVDARVTLPPWDNTAMDGFAVRAADTDGASADAPVTLPVTGEVPAGHAPSSPLEPGTAIRITTGAMIPPGADAVVPVEDTDAPPGADRLPDRVEIRRPARAGDNVRTAGSDVAAGARLLEPGAVVGPAALALLAATGISEVRVRRRPRVAVIATGDELVAIGEPLGTAQIYDSNSLALVAQARAAGAEARRLGIARDRLGSVVALLDEARAWADVIVLSGGVSVGAHDVVKDAVASLGSIGFWRVAIQPGKPLAYGRAAREGAGAGTAPLDDAPPISVFGLPGNPVSAFVTFELFVRPLLRRLEGRGDGSGRRVVRAMLAEPVHKSPDRRGFLRVRLSPDPARPGGLLARLAGGQGSHVLSALAAADGLAIVPEGVPGLDAGAEVDVLELDDEGA